MQSLGGTFLSALGIAWVFAMVCDNCCLAVPCLKPKLPNKNW